eukprot:362607-Chlamydomonas_euryale.AAC.22
MHVDASEPQLWLQRFVNPNGAYCSCTVVAICAKALLWSLRPFTRPRTFWRKRHHFLEELSSVPAPPGIQNERGNYAACTCVHAHPMGGLSEASGDGRVRVRVTGSDLRRVRLCEAWYLEPQAMAGRAIYSVR